MIGAPDAMVPVAGRSPGATVTLGNNADALLYGCSGQGGTMMEAPGLSRVPLPPGLAVRAIYAMAPIDETPDATRLALVLVSGKRQASLARHAFEPNGGP